MTVKRHVKFSVSGVHPLLSFVRDFFIRKRFALVSWEDEPDFGLIGADIGEELHPPLAQLELQKMQLKDKPVLLLSTPKAGARDLVSAAGIYAQAAEYLFGLGNCISVRPFNVYGPSITNGLVHSSILDARRQSPELLIPKVPIRSSFLYEDDFTRIIYELLVRAAYSVIDVGSPYSVFYEHAVSNIWQFVNGPSVPISPISKKDFYAPGVPNLRTLEDYLGWTPKTSLRSGLLKML